MDLDAPYYAKQSAEEVEIYLQNIKKKITKHLFPLPRNRLVIAEKVSNDFLGSVSWYWTSKETNWMSNGIVICDEQYWGKGIGFEALGLWNQYLLDEFPQVARLDLRSWSGNIGMMKLAEKLGYTLEARFRKARIVKGEYYDSVGYGMLREEWEECYPNGFSSYLQSL